MLKNAEKKVFDLQKSKELLINKNGRDTTVPVVLSEILQVLQQLYENRINDKKDILTEEQAAELLNLSIPALKRYALKTHEICYSRVGRKIVFQRKDLLAFLENRKTASIYERGGAL